MELRCIDPRTDPLWDRLIQVSPEASVFNSPAWLTVLAETYGWTPSAYVLVDERNEPHAGIAFFRIDDAVSERIVTLPFSDFCDPLGSDATLWHVLGDRLVAEGCSIKIRCVHNTAPLVDARFVQVNRARWHGIDLSPALDNLWQNLDRTARQCVEKARREGVRVEPASDTRELRAFYNMHLRVRKYKYHMLAQPFSFFETIWKHFIETDQGVLLLARVGEALVGGGFFLAWKDGLYYKFNTSELSGLDHRPNDLIVWRGIEHAKQHACTLFDFGLSDWDQTGLVRYKLKFGTYEKEIHFLQHTPDRMLTDQQREQRIRSLFPQLTDLFTDASVPDAVTEQAGSVLYRYFT